MARSSKNFDPAGLSRSAKPDKQGPVILQLVPALDEGGVERGALEIAEAIIEAGGRALIATAGGKMEPRLRQMGGEVFRMPLHRKGPLRMWMNTQRLKRLIRREKVDLVHARSRAPAWSGWKAVQKTRTPFVTTYHGAYNEGPPGKRRYNSVMSRGKPVIAVSNFIAEMIHNRHATPVENIVTIPRGADLSIFNRHLVTSERIASLVQAWHMEDEQRPVFMLPGRLTRWKGQEVFIDACKILRERRGPEAFLGLIVGTAKEGSDYLNALDKRLSKTQTGDCIRIVGACNDMPAAYMLSSCVLSASTDPEAFGRVAVEAQAMGCPVIATNHGGGCETVEDDITGVLVEPGDPSSMASAMEEILDLTEEERGWVYDAATSRVAKHFSIERMQESTLDVYENVLGYPFPWRKPIQQ